MLEHIEDLRTLTNEDVTKIIERFRKGFPHAIDNPQYRSAFGFALLLEITQQLREINKKLDRQ